MLQSQLFTKTRREAPRDEDAKNAKLLIRAGFINKEMSGVYSLLPLGLRVISKIKKIVGEEMEDLGSEEILMSTLQNKETWEKTGRWDDKNVDIWFKSRLKSDAEVGFGWSHEEPITALMRSFVTSYADLPIKVHQFQNKLRNELRAKSGIMRCREFLMKDMYCFAKSEEENMDFYNKTIEAYKKIFKRLGIGDITYLTSASGGVFTDKFSHEFQTICDAGEDTIFVNHEKQVAVNKEIFNRETLEKMGMKEGDFEEMKAAEVGNIFNFGAKKSQDMDLFFNDSGGVKQPVQLSSYGIGITRLLGVIAEVKSTDESIIWPETISPFKYHLIQIQSDSEKMEEINKTALDVYRELGEENVLLDERDLRAGEKFADADLIGIPFRIVVSEKTVSQGKIELIDRVAGTSKLLTVSEIGTLT